MEEGDAGVVDTPLAVAASTGAGWREVSGRRVERAEADGDGDLLHDAAALLRSLAVVEGGDWEDDFKFRCERGAGYAYRKGERVSGDL